MSYFLLPEIHNIIECINLTNSEPTNEPTSNTNNDPTSNTNSNENSVYVSKTLNVYLNNIKKHIDENIDTWDYNKKYTNPYEFIHTIVPNNKYSVSKLKPMSRSFYKMIEMTNLFYLFEDFKYENMKSFHLAEGPGGFIEATSYMRKNVNDIYYGMTLIDNDPNVPGWKKTKHFLDTNSNIRIECGATNTGDLLSVENLQYCYNKYHNSMNIITADGGFDFSVDFNKQEGMASNLLIAQSSFAIAMQKIGGHFILKIFDIFTKTTCDILYLLCSLYKKVYIVKPNTSRLANSEKYIVCKYFKGSHSNLIPNIINEYPKLLQYNSISSIINSKLDYYFINRVEEINAIFGQQQIENINTTLSLSNNTKNEKIESLKKNNIQKSIHWCEKFNIPHNKNVLSTNIFMTNSITRKCYDNTDTDNTGAVTAADNTIAVSADDNTIDPVTVDDNTIDDNTIDAVTVADSTIDIRYSNMTP